MIHIVIHRSIENDFLLSGFRKGCLAAHPEIIRNQCNLADRLAIYDTIKAILGCRHSGSTAPQRIDAHAVRLSSQVSAIGNRLVVITYHGQLESALRIQPCGNSI